MRQFLRFTVHLVAMIAFYATSYFLYREHLYGGAAAVLALALIFTLGVAESY